MVTGAKRLQYTNAEKTGKITKKTLEELFGKLIKAETTLCQKSLRNTVKKVQESIKLILPKPSEAQHRKIRRST